jgi:hypothetical protein
VSLSENGGQGGGERKIFLFPAIGEAAIKSAVSVCRPEQIQIKHRR